jgi:hypothetical protein
LARVFLLSKAFENSNALFIFGTNNIFLYPTIFLKNIHLSRIWKLYWKLKELWTAFLSHHRLRLHQKQHLQHNRKHLINLTTEEDEVVERDVEGVVHSEVEEVHQPMVVVEQIISTETPIIPDMDKTLAIIDRIMEINHNNILSSTRIVNNIRSRSSINPLNNTNLLSNINLHLGHMSILHLVTCKLRSILNLKCLNMGSKMDKTTNLHT